MLPNWLYGKSKSKLASILGVPSDYEQVKSQVTSLTSAFVSNVNENGCKNLFFYLDQSGTNAGITTSRNKDDSFSLTAGTATSNFMFPMFNEAWAQKIGNSLKKGITYIFSIGTSNSNMSLEVYHYHNNSATRLAYVDGGSEVAFTMPSDFIDGDGIWARVWITSGKTIPNITLYPMICLATDYALDPSYVPHAKTNQELTDDVADIAYEALTDYGSSEYTLTEGKMWQTKGVTFLYVVVTCNIVSPSSGGSHIKISEIPSKFKKPPFNLYSAIAPYKDNTTGNGIQLQINTNGNIAIRGGEVNAKYNGILSY